MKRPSAYTGTSVSHIYNAIGAAAVAGTPLMVVGPSGSGKTDPILAALSLYTGGDADRVWRQTIGGGTPPSVIEGTINVRALVETDQVVITELGTPHDPRYDAVLVDEITRGNSAVLSALLKVLGRRGWEAFNANHPPLRIGTSNFSWWELATHLRGPSMRSLEAISDRMATLWTPAPIITPEFPFEEFVTGAMVRLSTTTFSEHAENAVLGGEIDAASAVPRAREVKAFVRMIADERVRPIVADIARRSDIGDILTDLSRKAGATLNASPGNELVMSPRRLDSWATMIISTAFFGQWRKADVAKWRECYIRNNNEDWDEYARIAAGQASDWSIAAETFTPFTLYGLISAFPSHSEEVFHAWSVAVKETIGGPEEMIRLLRTIYAEAVRATTMGQRQSATQIKHALDEIAGFNFPFARRLAALYFELANRYHADPDHAEQYAHMLSFLDPKTWPLDEPQRQEAERAFAQFGIEDVATQGKKAVRRRTSH